jgi:hypothetical protein
MPKNQTRAQKLARQIQKENPGKRYTECLREAQERLSSEQKGTQNGPGTHIPGPSGDA